MKERTRKMLLIITIVVAGFTIVAKTILNTDYYNIVKAINKNYDIQNPIDYQDEETNKDTNIENQETTETDNNQTDNNVQDEIDTNNQIDNNETGNTDIVEDNSNQNETSKDNNNTEETTMPSRPSVGM